MLLWIALASSACDASEADEPSGTGGQAPVRITEGGSSDSVGSSAGQSSAATGQGGSNSVSRSGIGESTRNTKDGSGGQEESVSGGNPEVGNASDGEGGSSSSVKESVTQRSATNEGGSTSVSRSDGDGGTDDTRDGSAAGAATGSASEDRKGGLDGGPDGMHDGGQTVDIDGGVSPQPNGETSVPWLDEKYVSVDEVHDRWQSRDPEMVLVNVVDEEFYHLGHIEGSAKIPWDTLTDHLDQLDTDQHIVIYCRKGVRSESAYQTLSESGYPNVWVMQGGIEAWTAEGYPTVPD
ncbi:rhodanese-like domain-containing protein [Myxococcota bacterium]